MLALCIGFVLIVLENPDYYNLSTKSKALLIEIAYQYNGKNNGDMTVARKILKTRGWNRDATLYVRAPSIATLFLWNEIFC